MTDFFTAYEKYVHEDPQPAVSQQSESLIDEPKSDPNAEPKAEPSALEEYVNSLTEEQKAELKEMIREKESEPNGYN